MKLSVIVPCYNVEKYVAECVKSISKARIDDMEIILVNDGSTDDTLELLKTLKDKYGNIIKVVDKKNGGLSDARNVGIKHASGKYISFIDSDDTIEENLYKDLEKYIDKEEYDIITFGENRVFSDHTVQVLSGVDKPCTTKDEIKEIMPFIYPAACSKIYKKELFNIVQFKKGIWFEDVDFIYKLLPHINSITNLDGYYYNYYQREGSITYTYNSKLYDFIDNLNNIVKYYKDNNFYNDYYDELEYTYVRYLYATFIKRLAKMNNKEEFKKGVNRVIEEVNNTFPNYKKNKYLKGKKGIYLKHFNKVLANAIYYIEKNRKN